MRIAIVGSGYVGLTAAACLASLGHEVRCVDVVPERIAAIERGQIPFFEPGLDELVSSALNGGRLFATTDVVDAVVQSEVTIIAVGTPQGPEGIDLSFVEAATRSIGRALRDVSDYHVVVVKSTVVPGTADTVVRPIIERESRRNAGEFGLCVNPEFLREGHAVSDFLNPDRHVIGEWDRRSGDKVERLYAGFTCPVIRTTLTNAEMIKYASNALLATLVSFSNEIASMCEATPGADVQTILRGVHLDQRLSPVVAGERVTPGILSYLWAGCGFGGSCLPKDVNALRAYARKQNVGVPLLDAVMTVNAQRPLSLVDLVEKAVGSLRDTTIAVLGLAFKPETSDLRDSPALPVIRTLLERGATVRVYDPIVTGNRDSASPGLAREPCEPGQHLGLPGNVGLSATKDAALRDADAAVLVTACPEFLSCDWEQVCLIMRQSLVIDGRGALGDVSWPADARYLSIGRAADPAAPSRVLVG